MFPYFNSVCVILLISLLHSNANNSEFCGKDDADVDCNSIPDPNIADNKVKLSEQEIHENLKRRIKSIRQSCGEVCDTSIKGIPGTYYEEITKEFNCPALFSNPDIDAPGEFPQPPKEIPDYLIDDFSYNGQLKLLTYYRNDAVKYAPQVDWTGATFQVYGDFYKKNTLRGSYGPATVKLMTKYLDEHVVVQGKRVLVIGSENPWIEVILLAKGAKFVTTLDYVKIKCDHPKVETLTPNEIAEKYLKENVQYDIMITFSSVEHSGLGRYGDMLNPWGDLIAMARAWCLVKPGGKALVGVPSGPDTIIFNSHRLYGPLSYAHLFANWVVDYTDNDFAEFNKTGCDFCYQPFHVLQRIY